MKTSASICTGGGLFDVGAQMAGYQLMWGIEHDPVIAEVASTNLPTKMIADCVTKVDWRKLERPDHLHMSPPCQNASVAKQVEDETARETRGDKEIAQACCDAISILRPDTVTLENVMGYRKFKSFQQIVDTLWGLGYWVNVDILNSADFGVPQTRKRLILRAIKGGFVPALPTPKRWIGWYEAISDLIPELPESEFAPWQLERLPKGLFETCLVGRTGTLEIVNKNDPAYTLTSQKTGDFRAFLLNSNQSDWGDHLRGSDEPSYTIRCASGGRSRAFLVNESATMEVREPQQPATTQVASGRSLRQRAWLEMGRVVAMTPRALARFQSVPDWYQLPDRKQLACTIIGNGVPCLMARGVLESLAA